VIIWKCDTRTCYAVTGHTNTKRHYDLRWYRNCWFVC